MKTQISDVSEVVVPKIGRVLFSLLRLKQWTKNFIIFAPAIFGHVIFDPRILFSVTICFISFCLTASGIYVLNDIKDRNFDRLHPKKKYRPIAAGYISTRFAGILCLSLIIIASLLTILYLGAVELSMIGGYLLLNVLYMCWLKEVPVLDIACIASGFVIRAVAGGVAARVPLSSWFILCIFFLSLFLALGKRRHEIIILKDNAQNHRKVLSLYSLPYLDQLICVVACCTILTYAVYAVEKASFAMSNDIVWTVPLVTYGIFRYLWLVQFKNEGGAPEDTLLGDKHILLTILLYGFCIV